MAEQSYRQSFGLDNPPSGTLVKIEYMSGAGYYILWVDCPDGENIVELDFASKGKATDWALSKNYAG